MVDKVLKVSMGDNSIKNSRIKILRLHADLHIIERKSTKFQVNPTKDVGGVAKTRSWLAKFKSVWVILHQKYSNQNSKTIRTSSYHKKSTQFQVNPMKDIGGVAETRSSAGRTDAGHFYSPPPATSGDKNGNRG